MFFCSMVVHNFEQNTKQELAVALNLELDAGDMKTYECSQNIV